MSHVAENETYKGHNIDICYDECGESPREWDNITEIHYHSSRYTLGDTNWYNKIDEYDAMLRKAKRQGDLVIPMFAYIHSGIALSLQSFYGRLPQGHAEFDSGRAGTVIVRRKDILDNWGTGKKKRITKAMLESAYNSAKGDIETLNQYFSGEVYGYSIDDGEESCWGFYGEIEEIMQEAKDIVDWMVKDTIKKHYEKVKTWIKNKVPLHIRTTLASALA